jgi:hypothetical protein
VGDNSRRSCRARGPVLQLLKRERYAIIADIEYDYAGAQDPIEGSEEVLCLLPRYTRIAHEKESE